MGATVSCCCCCPKRRSSRATRDVSKEADVTLDWSQDKLASTAGSGGSMPAGHRQCSIEIRNNSSHYILRYVGVHLVSGFCALPLPLKIKPSSSGKALFSKTGGTACGAVGVFTYDLYNKSKGQTAGRLAVMFSVPFNFNFYYSWYAVGVFEDSRACNYDLYYQMYYDNGDMFTREIAGNEINRRNGPVAITASMTNAYQPILTLEVRDN